MKHTYETKWEHDKIMKCEGNWKLYQDGVDITEKIPENLRNHPMNTEKYYEEWEFLEDYSVEWYTYKDGYNDREWIDENPWVKEITKDKKEMRDIYYAFNDHDWRHGSCGACI